MPKFDFNASLQSNFIEIILWHGCPPVNVLHIFRTPFPKNISRGLLLNYARNEMKLPMEFHLTLVRRIYKGIDFPRHCCERVQL